MNEINPLTEEDIHTIAKKS